MLQARERCVQCMWLQNAGERPLGRHRHRWKGIKMDNKETQLEDTDWIHLILDRDKWRGCFDHGNSPMCSIKGPRIGTGGGRL